MKTDRLVTPEKVDKFTARQTFVCPGSDVLAVVPRRTCEFSQEFSGFRRVSGTYRFGLGLEVWEAVR
jgi:hypothetical protein